MMTEAPLKKVTVPAGLPVPVTVAERVTLAPSAAGFGLADIVVVVLTACAGVLTVYDAPSAPRLTSMSCQRTAVVPTWPRPLGTLLHFSTHSVDPLG